MKEIDLSKYKFESYPIFLNPILTEEGYEVKLPIEMFDGCRVSDKETGEFLGWVNGKKKCIEKYEVKRGGLD